MSTQKFSNQQLIDKLIRENKRLKRKTSILEKENKFLKTEMEKMKKTLSWKVTSPLRLVRIFLRKISTLAIKAENVLKIFGFSNFKKVIRSVKLIGFKGTFRAVKYRLRKNPTNSYNVWMHYNDPSRKELSVQRNTVFKINPKISILVPMYNTPIEFFSELIDYMLNQTYKNWELCLEDGSPEKNTEIETICKKDKRIKYNYTGNNRGISGNTNEALRRATGDYIALLDHDDLLPYNCLFEVVKAINEDPTIEFIYTDEDKFTTMDKPRFDPHFKPDFAIDTLRTNNYICHFSVFRRDIMEKLGGERSEYDGAQDYDLILHMTEIAKNIKHIPKILYHWRVHDLSTSKAGGDAKPYAFEMGIKVLTDHLKRVGLDGEVRHGATFDSYEVEYKVKGNPKVTILIPNCNEQKTLKK